MERKVLIDTYGCTLNRADGDIMARELQRQGYLVETNARNGYDGYDFVILNTCTVKKSTERKIAKRIESLKHMDEKLIVSGCMASANADIIKKIAPMSSIISTGNIDRIFDVVSGNEKRITRYRALDKSSLIPLSGGVIARIPISEGCLSACGFCETKFARGPLNSFSEDVLLRAIEMNVKGGAGEVELTSQDTGAYGLDKRTNIANLVSRASELDGDFRIRVGMLNPEHLHRYFDQLIKAYQSGKVYKFLHIPVQSGSNKVLGDMRRNYMREEFISYCKEAYRKIEDLNIATDIIVGYPKETDADFRQTIDLLEEIRPNITNVSKFAMRPHASASKMEQVGGTKIKERSIIASRVSRRIQMEIRNNMIGDIRSVLVTEKGNKSVMGRDDSYYQIAITNGKVSVGDRIDVRITGATQGCLLAAGI